MACVYCDSYKLEKEHKCADGNISLILCKRSLENSADNELFRKKKQKKDLCLVSLEALRHADKPPNLEIS